MNERDALAGQLVAALCNTRAALVVLVKAHRHAAEPDVGPKRHPSPRTGRRAWGRVADNAVVPGERAVHAAVDVGFTERLQR
eukprot:363284-Chlamydomonas_euryale.AAC.4